MNFPVRTSGVRALIALSCAWITFLPIFSLRAVASEQTLDLSPLKSWLASQRSVRSVSADFTQIRSFKTLKSPLTIKGHVWIETPNRFRWQLGEPPKTIIIGNRGETLILHPSKHRAEKRSLSAPGAAPHGDPFGMMGFPGGHSFEEFQKQMSILSLRTEGSLCHLEMLPRDAQAIQALSCINLDFDTTTGEWRSFEIVTKEGSSIRTEFSRVELNSKLPQGLFEYDLNGFTVEDEKK
jgi:outer membrane lipoprotein carrier protein